MELPHQQISTYDAGAEGVFVGSGIFKSGNPQKQAEAIVKAIANFNDKKAIALLSEDLSYDRNK